MTGPTGQFGLLVNALRLCWRSRRALKIGCLNQPISTLAKNILGRRIHQKIFDLAIRASRVKKTNKQKRKQKNKQTNNTKLRPGDPSRRTCDSLGKELYWLSDQALCIWGRLVESIQINMRVFRGIQNAFVGVSCCRKSHIRLEEVSNSTIRLEINVNFNPKVTCREKSLTLETSVNT